MVNSYFIYDREEERIFKCWQYDDIRRASSKVNKKMLPLILLFIFEEIILKLLRLAKEFYLIRFFKPKLISFFATHLA